MTRTVAAALVAGIALLSGCSSPVPSPRLATPSETQAILAPVLPHDPESHFCVSPTLRPPLEDEPQSAYLAEQRSWIARLKAVFTFGNGSRGTVWVQSGKNGPGLKLQPEDSDHLERLLQQAAKAKLANNILRLVLPKDIRACTKADETSGDDDTTPHTNFNFSRPVVVGNIAFVERGAVCGGLCGSGDLLALIRRKGEWRPLAEHTTWIA